MPKLPWYPFYTRDFFGDEKVKLMSHAQVGMYMRLLDHQWTEGSITEQVARSFCSNNGKRSSTEWTAMRQVVEQCFTLLCADPTRMMNPRLERIRAEQEAKEAIQHDIRVKGGQARAKQIAQQPGKQNGSSQVSSSSGNQNQSQNQSQREKEESPLKVPLSSNGQIDSPPVDNSPLRPDEIKQMYDVWGIKLGDMPDAQA